MTTRIVGLSDDLTGALALAAELKSAGLAVTVLGWDARPAPTDSTVVFDTASRLVEPEVAADRVATLVGRHEIQATALIFKRIDSGLRGNWPAELAAIADVVGRPVLVGLASPLLGVSVHAGGVLRDGHPTGSSHYSQDHEGDASELLSRLPPPVASVGRRRLAGGATKLAPLLSDHGSVVFDGRDSADLRTVAEIALLAAPCIAVGAYGLAGQIGRLLATRPDRGVLAVCGSYKEATLRQLRTASEMGWLVANANRIAPSRVMHELESGRHVVLTCFDPKGSAPSRRLVEPAQVLARRAAEIIKAGRLAGLLMIGGELSSALVAELGVHLIEPLVEPWPTIPLVELSMAGSHPLVGCAKSGSMGEPWWLVQAAGVVAAWTEMSRLSRFMVDPPDGSSYPRQRPHST